MFHSLLLCVPYLRPGETRALSQTCEWMTTHVLGNANTQRRCADIILSNPATDYIPMDARCFMRCFAWYRKTFGDVHGMKFAYKYRPTLSMYDGRLEYQRFLMSWYVLRLHTSTASKETMGEVLGMVQTCYDDMVLKFTQ